MGAKIAKQTQAKPYAKMNKTTKSLYYRAEFQCMGDVLKDGHLNQREFTRLMSLLGLPQLDRAAEILWNKQKKRDGSRMNVDEYVHMMSDPSLDSQTSMWRKLFAQFDTDGSGWASRQDVIQGLQKMGIEVNDSMRAKIEAMDGDKDGRVYYGDFLKMQLLNK
ncbi:16 kDa calcium-binding protein-like isoform X2 [Babylonia areolata]|uniref:16 kDa calcium-binding protein-like isoform X2 n=1 Tax=Babylonia areolata TaxID=304850 RepID=UPI003FD3426E